MRCWVRQLFCFLLMNTYCLRYFHVLCLFFLLETSFFFFLVTRDIVDYTRSWIVISQFQIWAACAAFEHCAGIASVTCILSPPSLSPYLFILLSQSLVSDSIQSPTVIIVFCHSDSIKLTRTRREGLGRSMIFRLRYLQDQSISRLGPSLWIPQKQKRKGTRLISILNSSPCLSGRFLLRSITNHS